LKKEKNFSVSSDFLLKKKANNLNISKKQYRRDSILFQQKVSTPVEFEEAEIKLLNGKSAYKNSEITLSNMQIQLSQLDQQILEVQLKDEEDRKRMLSTISSNAQALRNQLQTWEMTYALKSPVKGKVVLANFWSVNQQVKAGDQVMTLSSVAVQHGAPLRQPDELPRS